MSESSIHPTALVDPRARLGKHCVVGAHTVIDADVQVGDACWIGPHVYLTGVLVLGAQNRIHAGAVLGDAPQDLKYDGTPTRLEIGDGNTFREHVTIHRSTHPAEPTRIGDRNFLMAHCHVGHNCRLGNDNILANGVLLAGHVTLGDRVFLSGNCLVHQNCRVGRLALMQGGSAISKDLPPFCVARGDNGICGLNNVGLRRAAVSAEDRLWLKKAYHLLFRSRLPLARAMEQVRITLPEHALVEELLQFLEASRRGFCTDTSSR